MVRIALLFSLIFGGIAFAQSVGPVGSNPTLVQSGGTFPYIATNNNGYFVLGAQNASGLTSITPGTSVIRYQPFTVPQPVTLTQLGVIVTTAQASDSCNVGIYNDAKSGGADEPNSLLVSTGNLSTATVANIVSAAAAITLQPNTNGTNIYWAATICNSSTAAFRALSTAGTSPSLGFQPGAVSSYTVETATGSGTTLPTTATGPYTFATSAPIAVVGLQ
jgi:hypothetical protein